MFQNNLLMGAASAGGVSLVEVENSALFNTTNSEYLSRTLSGAGTSQKTFTVGGWVNRTSFSSATSTRLFQWDNGTTNTDRGFINFDNTVPDAIKLFLEDASDVVTVDYRTTQLFRDIGWFHWCLTVDTTPATPIFKFFINNAEVTAFTKTTDTLAQNDVFTISDSGARHGWGSAPEGTGYLDAYMAECFYLDGQVVTDATDFVDVDSTGLYITPKSNTGMKALSYGTHGYYLDNTTNAQTDASGNGNNFTNNNTVVTSTHTPTNLKPLLNPLNSSATTTLSNGNQSFVNSAANNISFGTIPLPSTGKWYFEYKLNNVSNASIVHLIGLMKLGQPASWNRAISGAGNDNTINYLAAAQQIWQDGSLLCSPATGAGAINDILSLAVDLDNTKMWIGFNNSFYNASGGTDGNPATGANAMSTKNFSDNYGIVTGLFQSQGTIQFDTDDFSYTPPSGYLALNSTNLTATTTRTASDTNKYFQTVLYEGNGGGQRVGAFQPFDNTFTVAKSSLFDDANSESLTRSFSTPTSADVWTFSTWLKRGDSTSTGVVTLFGGTYNRDLLFWNGGTYLQTMQNGANALNYGQYLEDASQWFHVMWTQNGTTATGYINGVQAVTATATNDTINSSGITHYIGNRATQAAPYDGYLAETVFIDGQALAPSNFGEVDTSTNRWVPKAVAGLTFGNNGFYLNYADSSAVGNDVSGNNNDWTNNNTVVQTTDSPTTNFAVLDPNVISGGAVTLSAGNLTQTGGAATVTCNVFATLPMRSGKWIMAGRPNVAQNYEQAIYVANETGVAANTTRMDQDTTGNFIGLDISTTSALETQQGAGVQNVNISPSLVGGTDYTVLAMDADNKKVYIGWHDVSGSTTYWLGNDRSTWNGNPATGAGAFSITGSEFKFVTASYTGRGGTVDFGQGTFLSNVTIPTGYLALSQDNMAGTEQFQSAFSWIKNRDALDNHMLFDRVRGATNDMHSNTTDAEVTNVNTVQRFLEAGVQVGNDVQVNTANESYVLWNWMIENTGSGASNEAGSINTTSTLVDTTLGLSISTYTGTGSNATVGHGLGVAPEMIIVKRTDSASGWYVQHTGMLATQFLELNSTGTATANASVWNSTFPTSTVFNIGTNAVTNASSATYLALCFAPSQFISIGSYIGNGNANGFFTPTLNSLGVPIQPVWTLIKATDLATRSWYLTDNKRNGNGNPIDRYLAANLTNVDADDSTPNDFVTGGIKGRGSGTSYNNSGTTYTYMAMGTPIIDVDGRIIAGR